MMQPKVSIVIPMYNVGCYAVPCIKSALDQTYENIEILVVDDGSTDETALLCEKALSEARNALVLKKQNGGLSSARNFGIAHATGDYLMFLDGDDLISSHAVDYLVSLAQRHNVKLATCRYEKITPRNHYEGVIVDRAQIVSGDELLRKMFLLKGESGSACAKLVHKDLMKNITFPEGQLFEDFGVMATLFARIDRACVSEAALYGYITREGSITGQKQYSEKHLLGLESSLRVTEDIVKRKPSLVKDYECFEAFCRLRVVSKLSKTVLQNDSIGKYMQTSKQLARRAAQCKDVSKIWRIRCALFGLSPTLHNVVYGVYAKITGKAVA